MHLVLGLGNPGGRYRGNRHNAGFMVVDRLAERAGVACDRKMLGALVAKTRVRGEDVVLAQPQSYMNLSGQPAASLRGFFKCPVEQVVVVHDELDLPFGDIRVKLGGGHGGHNGLRDIQARFGNNGFVRVRFGIGRPPEGWDTANYVLADFTAEESAQLDALLDRAADAVEAVVSEGVQAAMNRFNVKSAGRGARPDAAGTDAASSES